jgi:hypothetical protein
MITSEPESYAPIGVANNRRCGSRICSNPEVRKRVGQIGFPVVARIVAGPQPEAAARRRRLAGEIEDFLAVDEEGALGSRNLQLELVLARRVLVDEVEMVVLAFGPDENVLDIVGNVAG